MKIGFLSLPLSGHLNPMTALARKIQSRGKEILFFGVPDVEPVVRAANLTFIPVCEKEYPIGSMAKLYGPVAKLHGKDVLQYQVEQITPALLKVLLAELPGKLKETGVDAIVLDLQYSHLGIVPMSLGIPYVQVANALHFDFSGATPPCIFGWPYENTSEARARNLDGVKKLAGYMGMSVAVAKSYAEKVGLQINWNNPRETISKLAVITQTPKQFDFPNIPWQTQFHYTGPFHDNEGREPVPFPWEKLNGKPLIYASLGTLVNGLNRVYHAILQVAGKLPKFQVVLSIGKNIDFEEMGQVPSNTIVVRSAPQIELLKRAALCITHAGLNTTLEALGQGVPMVAIPIAYDQPGVAARIAYHGVGEFIEVDNLTVESLSEMIRKVLEDPNYRDKACYFQKIIADTHGLDKAADLIEQVFLKNFAAQSKPEDTVSLQG
jgi:zeaxanthin glucosyltransferase